MATKVSQATIDKIKKMGMTAALKSAPKANAEMTEALRRMYGQKRLDAASKASKPGRAVMTRPGSATKSTAPGAISGKTQVKMPGAGPAVKITQAKKANGLPGVTRGGSSSMKSPFGQGASTRKSVAGKPSIGEKISGVFTGKTKLGSNPTTSSVAATNAKRMGISVAEYNRRLNSGKK